MAASIFCLIGMAVILVIVAVSMEISDIINDRRDKKLKYIKEKEKAIQRRFKHIEELGRDFDIIEEKNKEIKTARDYSDIVNLGYNNAKCFECPDLDRRLFVCEKYKNVHFCTKK